MPKTYHTLLSCGHTVHHKKPLPEGDTLYCHECGEYVDVRTPPDIAVGFVYHAEYDCSTEPVPGKKARYLARCQRGGCTWTKEGTYNNSQSNMHQHQMSAHTRWGNPTLEGF